MAQAPVAEYKEKFSLYFDKLEFKVATNELKPNLEHCAICTKGKFLGCSDKNNCACGDWSNIIKSDVHQVYIDTTRKYNNDKLYEDIINFCSKDDGWEMELGVSVNSLLYINIIFITV